MQTSTVLLIIILRFICMTPSPILLFQSIDPCFQFILRYTAGKTFAFQPMAASGKPFKIFPTSSYPAAAGCTEWDHRSITEIIFFHKRVHDARFLSPPDRISYICLLQNDSAVHHFSTSMHRRPRARPDFVPSKCRRQPVHREVRRSTPRRSVFCHLLILLAPSGRYR